MLDLAADKFSNARCNDLEYDTFNGWTEEQKNEFLQEFNDVMESDNEDVESIEDFVLMQFLALKLTE